jgi:hypothetical protein
MLRLTVDASSIAAAAALAQTDCARREWPMTERNEGPHLPQVSRPASVPSIMAAFDRRYLAWGLPLCILCLLATAWHWSRPRPYSAGVPLLRAAGLLALAALLVNLPSYGLQRRSLRTRLGNGKPLHMGPFALRFYLVNVGLAIALTVLL